MVTPVSGHLKWTTVQVLGAEDPRKLGCVVGRASVALDVTDSLCDHTQVTAPFVFLKTRRLNHIWDIQGPSSSDILRV